MIENKKKTTIGAVAVCIAAMMWGLDGVVLTPRLLDLNVAFVVLVLHAIPFLLMNLVFFSQYKLLPKFQREDYTTFLIIAAFGGAIGTMALVKALFLVNFAKLSTIIILQKLQPVFGIALAAVLLKEKLQKHFAFWAIAAIVAGYFLSFGYKLPKHTGAHTIHAALLALLAAFSFAIATVYGKKILCKYDFTTATFYRFGFTSLLMLIYILAIGKIGEIHKTTTQHWEIFFLVALTTGSGAIYLYYYGLNKVTAMVATICELASPITAVLLDYFVNHSALSPVQLGGATVMIVAITKISLRLSEN